MLYKKIITVTFTIYASLFSPSHGGIYYLSSISSPFICPPHEPCNIHCDVDKESKTSKVFEYNCGNATDCTFHCEKNKCANEATIYGANAQNLTFTLTANGAQCFTDATIYAPHNGNAYFYNDNITAKGYNGITVYSGNNTQEIIINCDECNNMNVYASAAQFLRINLGILNLTTVFCPANSQYDGAQIAPCIIDATYGKMMFVSIDAPQGVPYGVHIIGCDACDSTLTVTCNVIDALNGAKSGLSAFPFNISSDCWWNASAHLTNNPTSSDTTQTLIDDDTIIVSLDEQPNMWWIVIVIMMGLIFMLFIGFIIYFLVKSTRDEKDSAMKNKKRHEQQIQNIQHIQHEQTKADVYDRSIQLQNMSQDFGIKHAQEAVENTNTTIIVQGPKKKKKNTLPEILIPNSNNIPSSGDDASISTPLMSAQENVSDKMPKHLLNAESVFSPVSPLETVEKTNVDNKERRFKI